MFISSRTESEQYFISLGAGKHQVSLIEAAKKLGYKVLAVDRNPEAVGFELSDLQLHCSITRASELIRLIEENLTRGIISGVAARSFGKVQETVALLSDYYHLPAFSAETIHAFQNKRKLKNRLKSTGINIPQNFSWRTEKQKDRLLSFRQNLIARPATGFGKKNIQFLRNSDQILKFINRNKDDGSILLEQFILADEVTVIGFVKNGQFHTISISDKIVSRHPPLCVELKHRYPTALPGEDQHYINKTMQTIAEQTGLMNSPLLAEFLIPEKGKPILVECAPELGGEYLADRMIPEMTGIDCFANLIHCFSGSMYRIKTEPETSGQCFIIRYLPQQSGIIKEIFIPNELFQDPAFAFFERLKENKDKVSLKGGNADRILVAGFKGALEHAHQIESRLDHWMDKIQIEYEK